MRLFLSLPFIIFGSFIVFGLSGLAWYGAPESRAAEPEACASGARLVTTQFIPVGRAATGLATGDFNHG